MTRTNFGWRRILALLGALAFLLLAGWMVTLRLATGAWPAWTGFGALRTPDGVYQPAKTLWDWLGLLVIPVALALAAIFFNRQERKAELQVAENRNQDAILQTYFDRIGELVLANHLLEIGPVIQEKLREEAWPAYGDDQPRPRRRAMRKTELEKLLPEGMAAVWSMAQVRTVTTLRQLDPARRAVVLQFLRDSGLDDFLLISASLARADLAGDDLSRFNLRGAYFSEANLAGAQFFGANLSAAQLYRANFSGADLYKANLAGARLFQANLSGAYLSRAALPGANLQEADLTGANLNGAVLDHANLTGARVTPEQLARAQSSAGAVLPNAQVLP